LPLRGSRETQWRSDSAIDVDADLLDDGEPTFTIRVRPSGAAPVREWPPRRDRGL